VRLTDNDANDAEGASGPDDASSSPRSDRANLTFYSMDRRRTAGSPRAGYEGGPFYSGCRMIVFRRTAADARGSKEYRALLAARSSAARARALPDAAPMAPGFVRSPATAPPTSRHSCTRTSAHRVRVDLTSRAGDLRAVVVNVAVRASSGSRMRKTLPRSDVSPRRTPASSSRRAVGRLPGT